MRRAALFALLVLVAAAAPAPAAAPRLTVYAAASLAGVLPAIDSKQRYSVGGSDTLALQIRQGAPADVYAAASPKYPDDLHAAGLVEKPVVFATNRLVLIVPASNPARIGDVFDLARPGVKLVIGQAGVPVGDYTRKVLATLGLSSALANVVSEETDVKGVVAKVALGEADAGIVYATDALAARGQVKTLRLASWAQPPVKYEIAIVRSSHNLAAARAFVAKVLSRAGRAQLKAAGFGPP